MYRTISESRASHNFWPGCSHDAVVIAIVYASKFAEWLLVLREGPGNNIFKKCCISNALMAWKILYGKTWAWTSLNHR